MGNWNINIQGVGAHHNSHNSTDANLMTEEFVRTLRSAGHVIEHATFTHGGKDFGVEEAVKSTNSPTCAPTGTVAACCVGT